MSETSRRARSAPPPPDDPSIPVLTERLTLPELDIDFTLPPVLTTPPVPRPSDESAVPPKAPASPPARHVPPPANEGTDWTRVEAELREAVLVELSQHLPRDVETIVRQHMAGAIDAAVQRLAQDTRTALANALHDLVAQAVRAEIERLRASGR
jgi:hypothetical protein